MKLIAGKLFISILIVFALSMGLQFATRLLSAPSDAAALLGVIVLFATFVVGYFTLWNLWLWMPAKPAQKEEEDV